MVEKLAKLKVGNGLAAGVEMGPVVSESQLETDLGYIEIAKKEGAVAGVRGSRLVSRRHGARALCRAHDLRRSCHRDAHRRRRGLWSGSRGHARGRFRRGDTLANSLPVGLSATLCTRDLSKALRYTRLIEAGVVKVNQISTGLALQAPFGGVKQSSTDSFKEQGPVALDFYTRTKTMYLDYSS